MLLRGLITHVTSSISLFWSQSLPNDGLFCFSLRSRSISNWQCHLVQLKRPSGIQCFAQKETGQLPTFEGKGKGGSANCASGSQRLQERGRRRAGRERARLGAAARCWPQLSATSWLHGAPALQTRSLLCLLSLFRHTEARQPVPSERFQL